jgi:Acetyl-coenzyme A transporter 1
VFFHYLGIGLVQGYFVSIQFNLQSTGAGLAAQSTLSFATYPYSFKFLISPLLDRFYFSKLGRSKSYIILGGLVIATTFSILGPTVKGMVDNAQVLPIALLFTIINIMVCVVQIAGEAWILTMFSKEEKTKASTFLSIGQSFGVILGYNVFTPLNDKEWLNNNIFTTNHLDGPLVTHTMFCVTVACLYFFAVTMNLLFISEEKILDKKAKDICKILAIMPRHLTNSHMRMFILYIFACRFIYFLIDFSLDLRLIKNGYLNLSRSTVSNIDTAIYPIVFSLSFCTIFFLKKGQLIRCFHLLMFVTVLSGTFKFLNVLNLEYNRDQNTAVIARIAYGIFQGMDFTTLFLMSFFNTIVNKNFGNTGITCLIALMNQTGSLSRTLGLTLSAHLHYETFVAMCLVGQATVLVLLFPYALVLDKKESKLYADSTDPQV